MEDLMPEIDLVTLRDGYVYMRPPKGLPASGILRDIAQATELCLQHSTFKLLINATEVTQQPPHMGEIFWLVVEASKFWDRRIRTAVVDPAHWLKHETFTEIVARNRGLLFSDFLTEAEAIQWLSQTDLIPHSSA